MELIRKQIYITRAQDRALKRLAQQQGTTEADILRKALDQFLTKEGRVGPEDPFADLIGIFEGPVEVDLRPLPLIFGIYCCVSLCSNRIIQRKIVLHP